MRPTKKEKTMKGDSDAYEIEEDDKIEEPRTITRGQREGIFDEALLQILPEKCGYDQDYGPENVKLIPMVIRVFAKVAVLPHAVSGQQKISRVVMEPISF